MLSLVLTVVSSQCCKVRQGSCRLTERFSLTQLFSPKTPESSSILARSQVCGIAPCISNHLNLKCTILTNCVVFLLGPAAASPRATRQIAGAGNEVAAQNSLVFFWATTQSSMFLSILRLVCTFFMIQVRTVHVLHTEMATWSVT